MTPQDQKILTQLNNNFFENLSNNNSNNQSNS